MKPLSIGFLSLILAFLPIAALTVVSPATTEAAGVDPLVATLEDGVGGFDNLDLPHDVDVQGDYMYVVSHVDDAFMIFNVSDPTTPSLESELVYDNTSPPTHPELEGAEIVVVDGNWAYVIATNNNDTYFSIIDIFDKTNPQVVFSVESGQSGYDNILRAKKLVVDGNYVYIGSENRKAVTIVDVTSHSNPVIKAEIEDGVGGFDYINHLVDLDIEGDRLFVTNSLDDVITVVDVTDKSNPTLEKELIGGDPGDLETMTNPRQMEVDGNTLYIEATGSNQQMMIVDITNINSPTLVSQTFQHVGFYALGHQDLELVGDKLVFVNRSGGSGGRVTFMDVSDKYHPRILGEYQHDNSDLRMGYPQAATFDGDYIYVTGSNSDTVVILDPFLYTFNDRPEPIDLELFPDYTDPFSSSHDFEVQGKTEFLKGETFIPVDPNGTLDYRIKGEFLSTGNDLSRFYFGFAEYDEDFNLISAQRVVRISPTTDSVNFTSISTDRKTITVDQTLPTSWCSGPTDTYGAGLSCSNSNTRNLGIYLDGDLDRTPDFYYKYNDISGSQINLKDPLPEVVAGMLTTNAEFLNHGSGNTYNYAGSEGASYAPAAWTQYTSDWIDGEHMSVDWTKFREGTRYIKPIIAANWGQNQLDDTELRIRNVSVESVTSGGSLRAINIPPVTKNDTHFIFRCEPGQKAFVEKEELDNDLIEDEGVYSLWAFCRDESEDGWYGHSKRYFLGFEIDKTAPAAPTWDAIESGTYTTGQTVGVTPDTDHKIITYGAANGESWKFLGYLDEIYMQSDGATNRTYDIRFRQYDKAGNASAYTATRSYTITP